MTAQHFTDQIACQPGEQFVLYARAVQQREPRIEPEKVEITE